jgi:hypothetical protein
MKNLCWSVTNDLSDMKIIHGGDVVGSFPKGFKITFTINENYVEEVALFVRDRLGQGTSTTKEAVHVFVSNKSDGHLLLGLLSRDDPKKNCRFVSADNSKEEINQVAAEWGQSSFDILISTSIALVGNENPKCRHLACAGYLFDMMSMVQFFGRLRPYMRSSTGQVLVCVPSELPSPRKSEDGQRWTKLLNGKYMGYLDYSKYEAAMTSKGLFDWVTDATNGTSGCVLKKLSVAMGKVRNDNCGACNSCRSAPLVVVQAVAENRIEEATSNGLACRSVLRGLEEQCLACNDKKCSGLAIKKKDSKGNPIVSCLKSNGCWTCGGVGKPHHRNSCFNRYYFQDKVCYDCWVWKHAPGAVPHDFGNCPVKHRLRRLLSYDYWKSVVDKEATPFQTYFELIYTSEESFCRFMAEVELKYMTTP